MIEKLKEQNSKLPAIDLLDIFADSSMFNPSKKDGPSKQ